MTKAILVEGPDCAGKSTLVKELKNHLNWDSLAVIHKSGHQYERYLSHYAAANQTIIERGHLSELVYSSLFGRPRPFSARQLKILNMVVAEGALVIIADAPNALLLQRFRARADTKQVVGAKSLLAAATMFRRWQSRLPAATRIISYQATTFDNLAQTVKAVRQMLEEGYDTDGS